MYEKEGDKRVSVHYDKLMKVLSGLVTFYDNLATASILYGDITLPIYEIQPRFSGGPAIDLVVAVVVVAAIAFNA